MTPEKLKHYREKCGMEIPREKHFAGLLAAGTLIGKMIQSARKGRKKGGSTDKAQRITYK